MTTPSTSAWRSLNWTDIWKGLRGALIVFASVFAIGGLEALQNAFATGQIDLGPLDPMSALVASGMSFVLEEVRRFFTNYQR